MPHPPPKPAPRPPPSRTAGPRKPVERLASLKNPTPGRRMQPKPTTTHPRTATCPNPNCPAPNVIEDDDKRVCSGCGTVISDSNIVAEVTFGESASGAAIVQGTYIGADQSHGRTFGPGFRRSGGLESREITEQNGKRYINQLSAALLIPQTISDAGFQIFKLAVGLNFIQGRRTKSVAAACLYIACRRQDGNTIMLIDFSDILMINVFKLGRSYMALLEELRLGGNVFLMNPINPEHLIWRFTKQLEFGEAMHDVAKEAVRIVARMNRDWMITGRRPAGICGAAIILAARMNNFRRTVREVVYVVKVTELTIHKRLDEFKTTESGSLTVEQFRSVDLETSHDPPAFRQAKDGIRKYERRKKRKGAPETAAEIEGDDEVTNDDAPATKKRRVDADGFTIPDIPMDPALRGQSTANSSSAIDPSLTSAVNTALSELESQPPPTPPTSQNDSSPAPPASFTTATSSGQPPVTPLKKRGPGRPKGSKNVKPPPPTTQDLAIEASLESEMTSLLSSSELNRASTPSASWTHVSNTGAPSNNTPSQTKPKSIPSTPEIANSEFDSDPEVANCLLTPQEVEIKERIWVHENRDYLRQQQARILKRQLLEELGTANPIKRRKRRKGRMGDVGYLNDSPGGEGEGGSAGAGSSRDSTPLSAAEATKRMLQKRGFSKKINYRLMEGLFGMGSGNGSSQGSRSRSSSVISGTGSKTGTPSLPSTPSRTTASNVAAAKEGAGKGGEALGGVPDRASASSPTVAGPTRPQGEDGDSIEKDVDIEDEVDEEAEDEEDEDEDGDEDDDVVDDVDDDERINAAFGGYYDDADDAGGDDEE